MADVDTNTPAEPQVPQLTEVEVRASEQGWVPQDQWDGDPDAWRPAKEFLDRGELFKKIDEQKRELKQLKVAMEEFGKHHAKVREIEYKRALETLKAQKRIALDEGDHETVVELDERIADTKAQVKEAAAEAAKPTSPQTEVNPEFVKWQARNAWYGTDRAMKGAADEIARDLILKGENDPIKILAVVDKEIRKEFPHKFENPNRAKPSAVEGSTNKSRAPKEDAVEMTDEQRRIMKRILDSTGMSKEQYLKEFKEYNKRG